MPPIVIRIQENLDGDEEVLYLVDNLPKAGRWVRLHCRSTDSPFRDVRDGTLAPHKVHEAGHKLFENLKRHPVIAGRFAAHAPQPNDVQTIYLHLQASRAEELPWEALFDDQYGFCCLNHRPIGRIVDSQREGSHVERPLTEPIRLAVVISAAGIDPVPEWDELARAIDGAHVDLEVHVFVAARALKEQIEGAHRPNVTVTYIVSREQLLEEITRVAPHLLHFFCHGSAQYGSYLDIASHADDLTGGAKCSVQLEGRDFAPADIRKSLWLVTLNACEGAAVDPEEQTSLAGALIDHGVPVVVAMRERVDAAVAHIVTQQFYESFFREVRRLLQLPMPAGGGPLRTTIEWADVLSKTRNRLIGWRNAVLPPSQAAREAKEWTLPALYVRAVPPLVLVRESSAGLSDEQLQWLGELNTLRKYRATAPAGTPASVLDQVDARIAALEQSLRG
jgi:hypothetical protein